MMKRILLFMIISISFTTQSCSQISRKTEKNVREIVDLFNNENYEDALVYIEKLLEDNPKDYVALMWKGRSLFNLGKKEKGIAVINEAIKIKPSYYKARFYRGVMRYSNGNLNGAFEDINFVVENEENNYDALLLRAGYYHMKNNFEQSVKDCNKLISNSKEKKYRALVIRGDNYVKLLKYDAAEKDYNEAQKLEPNYPDAYLSRGQLYLFTLKTSFDKALNDYDKLIKIYEKTDTPQRLLATTYNNRGLVKYNLGELNKGLEDVNHSISLLPSNSYAHRNRALIYIKQNRIEKACEDLQEAKNLGFQQQYGNEVLILIKKNCK